MQARRTSLAGFLSFWLLGAGPVGLEQRVLSAHNRERSAVGSPPLVWDKLLERDAAKWAGYLADAGQFEHELTDKALRDQGENLWQGDKASYTSDQMVARWVSEKAQFKRGHFPLVSKTGSFEDVGHYTQMIWHTTHRVGCAVASGSVDDVLVCRYAPPGNVAGQNPLVPARAARSKPRPVLKKRRRGG
jgi:hypothetical protein